MINQVDNVLHEQFLNDYFDAKSKIQTLQNVCRNDKTIDYSPQTVAARTAVMKLNDTFQKLQNLLPHAVKGMDELHEPQCANSLNSKYTEYVSRSNGIRQQYETACPIKNRPF